MRRSKIARYWSRSTVTGLLPSEEFEAHSRLWDVRYTLPQPHLLELLATGKVTLPAEQLTGKGVRA